MSVGLSVDFAKQTNKIAPHVKCGAKLQKANATIRTQAFEIFKTSKGYTFIRVRQFILQNNLNNISATIRKYFPNTPIYECVGNHEGVPMDA